MWQSIVSLYMHLINCGILYFGIRFYASLFIRHSSSVAIWRQSLTGLFSLFSLRLCSNGWTKSEKNNERVCQADYGSVHAMIILVTRGNAGRDRGKERNICTSNFDWTIFMCMRGSTWTPVSIRWNDGRGKQCSAPFLHDICDRRNKSHGIEYDCTPSLSKL